MFSKLRAFWAEPSPEGRPGISVGDRAIAVTTALAAVAEATLRADLSSPALAVVGGLVRAVAIWFRRVRPFEAHAAAFGVTSLLALTGLVSGVQPIELRAGAAALLLPYSLFRWGTGREAILGLPFLAALYVLNWVEGSIKDMNGAFGVAIVLLFPIVLGVAGRSRARVRRRELENAKLREREQLARELHDTVAHHLAAIAIQAQAAGVVVGARPEAATKALTAIDEEARLALPELRKLVGALRDARAPDLTTPVGFAAIVELTRLGSKEHAVEVELTGEFDGLSAPVQAALHRIAQESVTNALRHARRPHTISVRVAAEDAKVRLTVEDDGEMVQKRGDGGFGLVGMAERASLLGGTLKAGPNGERGWLVTAVLPRNGGLP